MEEGTAATLVVEHEEVEVPALAATPRPFEEEEEDKSDHDIFQILATTKQKRMAPAQATLAKVEPSSKFKCKVCDEGFSNKPGYVKHRKSKAHKTREKQIQADIEAKLQK